MPRPRPPSSLGVLLAGILACTGCATVSPRFSPEIAASFVHDDMQRMETDSLVVYYPAHARAAAQRTAARLEACVQLLRGRVYSEVERDKVVTIITSAEYNNAYVRAKAGGFPTELVVPLHLGIELFNYFDMGVSEVPDVSCHEAVHYVQLEQTDGFWRIVNLVFGDVISPNSFTETWFLEGLATWLEGNLGREQGRPHSPLFRGMYLSGVSEQGRLRYGNLNPADRLQYPLGGNYLSGSHFVEWLADTYGEESLWALIDRQGNSIFSPFGVTLRFRTVYGKTIGGLVDEYSAWLRTQVPPRQRPDGQQVIEGDLGYMARLSSAPDGTLAVVSVGVDQQSRLTVYEPDGAVRFSRAMTLTYPGRKWILSHPSSISGLSFTRDGASLFYFAEDLAADGAAAYAIRKFDARTGAHVQSWEGFVGLGGDVSPDGSGYVYIDLEKDESNLVRFDFATGERTTLTTFAHGTSLGAPAYSPGGDRIAFVRRSPNGFDLMLREADGALRTLTTDGRFNYAPRWVDEDTLVFMREVDGLSQAHLLTLSTGEIRRLSHAPWVVLDPVPRGANGIAFLNREDWYWSLDTIPLDPAAPVVARVEAAPWSPPPTTTPDPTVSSLRISEDGPYSPFDELFIPRLRAPGILAISTSSFERDIDAVFSLSLMGSDRLGFNAWAINAYFDTGIPEPSVQLGWGNYLLAPWYLTLSASRGLAEADLVVRDPVNESVNRIGTSRTTDYQVIIQGSRPVYSATVGGGFEFLQRHVRDTFTVDRPTAEADVRLVGPSLFGSWSAGAGTPYAGTQRGLSTSLSTTGYPQFLGSDFDLVDVRATLGGWIPLPVLERHTFALNLRGRTLIGEGNDLLQVGGVGGGIPVIDYGLDGEPGHNLFLPGLSFTEALRGYEDFAFFTDAAVILGARYRYPLIIDRGTTSFLWLFPSFFVRQIDVEAFFEGVQLDRADDSRHAAVGGMVSFRTLFGSALPVSLYYQYAWRTTSGLGSQHVVGLTFE